MVGREFGRVSPCPMVGLFTPIGTLKASVKMLTGL